MSQFFISCKESRIENNKSFYGCFYLGPFEPSQSITIANALRRTLLSELYGLGIVSVEIDGASHEYSSLPGVKDSVLDILLNLKEIVLKKTIKNFKPQIGYLRVRGPGVVRASHLRLPPFIQSVDPDQYIATLADNGFLNMKFIIQYGNKWLSPLNSLSGVSNQQTENKDETKKTKNSKNYTNAFNLHLKKRRLILKKLKQIGIASSNSYIKMFSQSASFLSKYAKKRNIFRRGINLAVTLSKKYSAKTLKTVPSGNLKKGPQKHYLWGLKKLSKSIEKDILGTSVAESRKSSIKANKTHNKKTKKYNLGSKEGGVIKGGNRLANSASEGMSKGGVGAFGKKAIFFAGNVFNDIPEAKDIKDIRAKKTLKTFPLTIDAVFNPINKVNYIIEINDFKTAASKMETSFETSELYEMLKNTKSATSTSAVALRNRSNQMDSPWANPYTPPKGGEGVAYIKYFPPIGGYRGLRAPQNQSTKGAGVNADFLDSAKKRDKDSKSYMQSQLIADQKITSSDLKQSQLYNTRVKQPFTPFSTVIAEELESIFSLKRQINALKKDTTKHNITLEVWTNGSIHPRDALYQGFKNLIKLFTKLKTINTFGGGSFYTLQSKASNPYPVTLLEQSSAQAIKPFKIKMGEIKSSFLQDLLPLNETSFLSTYVAPKLKNYYLNSQDAYKFDSRMDYIRKEVFKSPVKKNILVHEADIGILNLSLRSYTCLKRLGIKTIAELLALSKSDLSSLSFGVGGPKVLVQETKKKLTSLEEIEKSLEKIGLYFK